MRAVRIANLPLDYMANPRFSRRGADNACLGPMVENDTAARKPRRPSGLPPYLASLYEIPLLTREQEQHLFRKYNYLKFKAVKLRDELDFENPKAAVMDEIELLHEQIVDIKNQIARCNLRLVVSIAKRRVTPDQNFFELVSDGNLSLLRAVEKFDFARGNKFSTYASWAIMSGSAQDTTSCSPPPRRSGAIRSSRKACSRIGSRRSSAFCGGSTIASSRSSSADLDSIILASRSRSSKSAPSWESPRSEFGRSKPER